MQTIENSKDGDLNAKNYQIAKTALEQIFQGEPNLKLLVKHTSFDEDGTLQLRFQNRKGANHATVKYNHGTDLYDVEFWECRILKKDPYIIRKKHDDVSGLGFENIGPAIYRRVTN